ncbi:MAG: bifunctional alpha,alpha-trehalose-phosphate synthase (UDP-forming)/trehalose-phosphatase [Bacteroidetes bacterium]|nr:MAG: bifunctional alpha,alpha-trehalose-phosphate synthase (UDP-forming)/trehalose-phosphatase [Bacteroidota bacterium]
MNNNNNHLHERLVIVSNRLPFHVTIKENELLFNPSPGGLASGLKSYVESTTGLQSNFHHYLWVGWPGATVERELMSLVASKALAEYQSYPLFFSEHEMENFYHGFCNKTIWPLFHYFPSHAIYDQEFWESYKRVNEIFAERLFQVLRPGDTVWIHDYHLMLLPKLLKERTPDIPIGFFLHIPFPSFELFRLLPNRWRHELLEGMLGADLVGFHTFEYTQHFLQCVLRILGYEHYMGEISLPNRVAKVETFPMGIDFEKFSTALNLPEVRDEFDNIKATLSTVKVILSVDRLDYTKGILNRLEAFELLLQSNPGFHKNIVLVIILVPSRIGVEHYETMKRQIEETIGKINGKFGSVDWTPIVYQYKSLPFASLAALYHASDVALVTPLRDGMNLVAKEFIASKVGRPGVLILSEMAGAAKELGESIVINPNNKEEIASALKDSLEMPEEEQLRRNTIMQDRLQRYNVTKWASEFINQLNGITKRQNVFSAKLLSIQELVKMSEVYQESDKRLILLDYDGTLLPLTRHPHQAKPNERVLKVLRTLAADSKNVVVLVSGRDRNILQHWLGSLPIHFVAEHGIWIKEVDEQWKMIQEQSEAWKPSILQILEHYADRLPGVYLEEKEYSIAWHYRNADPEQSLQMARELTDHLMTYTANINLQVLSGKKVIEIRTAGTDKGQAALYWLSKHHVDFILAIGDDVTDENLFARLPDWAHTIRVGMTSTLAKYNLRDSTQVIRTLEMLAQAGRSAQIRAPRELAHS